VDRSAREALEAAWVPNAGGACTTAAILAGLRWLGVPDLPDLAPATLMLGARMPLGAPGLLDYVGWPGRRAPLDRQVERLARRRGLVVRSRSGLVLPGSPLAPAPGEALVVHLAWGREAPGRWGTWGWHPLRPETYSTGGHSVLLAAVEGREWLVLDPNLEGLQRWERPGIATARTRIEPIPWTFED
jgi:hypothetical protein